MVDGQDMPTVAAVRNLGARLSRGRLLCFVDADVTVTKSWAIRVTELASATGPDDMFVTGAEVRSEGIATWIDRSWFGISGRDLSHINSGNLLVSRHYFLSLGGFDARLLSGEDYELCTRARSHGGKVVPDDSLIALHTRQPDSLGSFLKREFWHGAGDFQSWATFRESKIAWACTLLLASVVFSVAAGCIDALVILAIYSLGSATRNRARRGLPKAASPRLGSSATLGSLCSVSCCANCESHCSTYWLTRRQLAWPVKVNCEPLPHTTNSEDRRHSERSAISQAAVRAQPFVIAADRAR